MNIIAVKAIFLLCAAVMLAACGGKTDDNQKGTDDVKTAPVSSALDGYNELDKNLSDKLKLPESIAVTVPGSVYKVGCSSEKNKVSELTVKDIFKRFYGESFDEKQLSSDEHGGLIYQAGENSSAYWGGDLVLTSESFVFPENEPSRIYDTVTEREEAFSFGGEKKTVEELSDSLKSSLSALLAGFYEDFGIGVRTIGIIDGSDYLKIECAITVGGVPMQYRTSEYMRQESDGSMTYWDFAALGGYWSPKGFELINASMPLTIREKTACEEIIPLTEAVGILDKELAEYSNYEIQNIELLMCGLTTQPFIDRLNEEAASAAEAAEEEYSRKVKTFAPMWCFQLPKVKDEIKYIKVNALDGEVFMDLR